MNTSAEDLQATITHRPEIQDGRPTLEGTGVTARRIAQWRALGFAPAAIAKVLGHVAEAQVEAALAYAETHRAEIEDDLAQEAEARAQLPPCPLPTVAPAEPLRFYIDEDSLWHPLWLALHAHHAEVLTALAVNLIAVPIAEHLTYATVQERLLLTFNARDYLDLHHLLAERGLTHAGVVVLRPQAASVEDVAHQLLELARTHTPAQLFNTVWRLS